MPIPTTRKYPRTLQEAFPKEYLGWFERHKPEPSWSSVRLALVIIFGMIYWAFR
jgi:hypothetical protein